MSVIKSKSLVEFVALLQQNNFRQGFYSIVAQYNVKPTDFASKSIEDKGSFLTIVHEGVKYTAWKSRESVDKTGTNWILSFERNDAGKDLPYRIELEDGSLREGVVEDGQMRLQAI